jgi:hypothetical protein
MHIGAIKLSMVALVAFGYVVAEGLAPADDACVGRDAHQQGVERRP